MIIAKELVGRQLADDVGARIEKQLQKRYAWLGVAVALLTGGLGTLIVKTTITDAVATIKVQEKLQERFTNQLEGIEDTVRASSELAKNLADLEIRIQDAARKEGVLNTRLSNASTTTLSVSASLQDQIDGLRIVVEELADRVDSPVDLGAVAKASIRTGEDIISAVDRAEKQLFPLHVKTSGVLGDNSLALIRAAGFEIDYTADDMDVGDPSFVKTIRVTSAVPPQFVVELVEAVGRSNGLPINHIDLDADEEIQQVWITWVFKSLVRTLDLPRIRKMKTVEEFQKWLGDG